MKARALIFYTSRPTFAYPEDWRDAFIASPALEVTACDLARPLWIRHLPLVLSADLVVFLHTAPQGLPSTPRLLRAALSRRRGQMVYFARNEFKGFQEKIDLANDLGVECIASQLPLDAARWIYESARSSRILEVPHALNPQAYSSSIPSHARPIDIGARSVDYPWFLGDRDRVEILREFARRAPECGLSCDISFDERDRFDRSGWAAFLAKCRCTASTEAGAAFLERDDHTRFAVERFLAQHPSATYEEVRDRFLQPRTGAISGKCISSRHFEAIGTKTCQIMYPGRFNDILRPDEHYIALAPDLSNFSSVVERVRDADYCQAVADRAHRFVLASHTHGHRVAALLSALGLDSTGGP